MFHGMGKRKKLTNSYYLPEGSINAPNESKDVDKVRHGFTGHEYSNGAKNGGGKFGANVPLPIISRLSIVTIFQETVNPVSRVTLI